MVKGITRQVILVKSPDPRLFEEAIFIVKEEALAREGVTASQPNSRTRAVTKAARVMGWPRPNLSPPTPSKRPSSVARRTLSSHQWPLGMSL